MVPVKSESEWAVVVVVVSGFNRQLVGLQACSLGARLGRVGVVGCHGQIYGRAGMVSQLISRACLSILGSDELDVAFFGVQAYALGVGSAAFHESSWCPHDLKFVFLLFVQDVHLPPQAFLRVRRSRSFRHALVRLGHGTVQPRKYLEVHLMS